jgi:hypothetical protein
MTTDQPLAAGDRDPRPGLPAQGQIRRLMLSGSRNVIGRCREFACQALWDWRWLPAENEEQRQLAEDVLLVVSELVTNALLHADGARELVLHGTGECLRIEVADTSPAAPVPRRPARAGSPGGHGLLVVAVLAREWGWSQLGQGKVVWAEVAGVSDRAPAASRQAETRSARGGGEGHA